MGGISTGLVFPGRDDCFVLIVIIGFDHVLLGRYFESSDGFDFFFFWMIKRELKEGEPHDE